jgi:MFS family permease
VVALIHRRGVGGAAMTMGAARGAHRWALFALAFIASALVAGTVYGWPPLRRLLLEEDSNASEKALGAVFTAGSWSVQGGRFVAGISRDHFGTRFTCCACLACVVAGAAMIALAKVGDDASLTAGMFAVGLGSGVQLCVQPVAVLFPEYSSTIMSALSGAFQISGLVFLALTAGGDRKIGFLVFAGAAAALLATCAFALPRGTSFLETPAAVDDDNVDDDSSTRGPEDVPVTVVVVPTRKEGLMNGETRSEQLSSPEFIGLVAWFTIVVCPAQFFISTIGYQMEQKGDVSGSYSSIFSATYGAVAIFAAVGGRVADAVGCGACQGFATACIAFSFAILALPSSAGLEVQGLGMTVYSLGRLFIFAMYFSNIGRRFGFVNYGTLAGVGLLISAIWSLLQYPLLAWAVDSGATGANVLCMCMLCATMPYTVWLAKRERLERIERRKS